MQDNENINFGGKAIYEIQAVGNLSQISSDLFGDMVIESTQLSENKYKFTIKGLLRDQAELSGLLNTIYEMHLSVVSVNCIET